MRTATARLLHTVCLLLLVGCTGTRSAGTRAESPAPSASSIVLLVRHAEKASEGDDPPLTPAGQQRAMALAEVARDAGVTALYTTQLRRTRETAQPLADRLGVPITVREIPPRGAQEHARALARELLARPRGETILVVEHSNTLPQILETMTGVRIQPLSDNEYDRLFVVVLPPSGPARLIQARYGAPSAP